jgi:hypothetical protein
MRKRAYNLAVTPLVPFRAVILLSAYGLEWLSKRLEDIGGAIPGWRR